MKTDSGETSSRPFRLRTRFVAATLGVTMAGAVGCTAVNHADAEGPSKLATATAKPAQRPVGAPKKRWFEIGKASWYGKAFNGHRTANGERFDMMAWTCAHRTLPLGSWVKVTNLLNRKAVFLRVNDRGPVPESHVVDLSYAAAQRIGISGLAKVKVESIPANDPKLIDQMMASVKPTDRPAWPVTLSWDR